MLNKLVMLIAAALLIALSCKAWQQHARYPSGSDFEVAEHILERYMKEDIIILDMDWKRDGWRDMQWEFIFAVDTYACFRAVVRPNHYDAPEIERISGKRCWPYGLE